MWAAVLLVADASVSAQTVAKYSYIKGDGIRFIAVTILICQRMRRVHRAWVDCLLLPDCISAYCAPAVPQRIVAFSVAHSPSECADTLGQFWPVGQSCALLRDHAGRQDQQRRR